MLVPAGALTHFIDVCVCVWPHRSTKGACAFVLHIFFFFFAPFFLAFCFKSNGAAEQIIRSSGCRDASPVHVEAAVTFIPLSSRQPVSGSIMCRSVLQASGRFFFPLSLKPPVRNCCQEPLRPPEGVALLFSGVSCGAQSEN